jgi:hypothetical protein
VTSRPVILPYGTSTLIRPNYITVTATPAPPSDVQVTALSWSQIRLDWQDNSSDETGFTIYDGVDYTDVGPDTTSYTFEGLAPGSYYCYIVRAFNANGSSEWNDDNGDGTPDWACTTTDPCAEALTNGGFEDDGGWEIPDTLYPAAYTTAMTHTGKRSMRIGIVEPADNRYSYSSVRQAVTIPTDVVSATLHFWIYPVSGESPARFVVPRRPLAATVEQLVLASDRQYVLVLDEYGQWLNTLLWQRTNDQQWTFHEFDLMTYAGQTIKLHFGAYNDGADGVTAMYVDDVSLEVCAKTTMPPNRPSNPTPSDGAIGQSVDVDLSWTGGDPDGDAVTYDVYLEADDDTPDVLVSESQTDTFYDPGSLITDTHYYWQIVAADEHGATMAGPIWDFTTSSRSGTEMIINGGFENGVGWAIPDTPYPATYTTAITRTGSRSMRAGIVESIDNRYSYSSFRQMVTIPAGVVSATLRFWLYPISGETPVGLSLPMRPLAATVEEAVLAGDRQYVLVLDEHDQWINTLVWQLTNDQRWTFHKFDLGVYIGRTIKLQFGAYNDGWGDVTAMYVDDVSLEVCCPSTVSQNDLRHHSDDDSHMVCGGCCYGDRCGRMGVPQRSR